MPAKYKRIVIKLKNFFSGSKSWKISSKKKPRSWWDWHRVGARGRRWNEFSASDVIKMMKSSGEEKIWKNHYSIKQFFRWNLRNFSWKIDCVFCRMRFGWSNSAESSNGKIKSFFTSDSKWFLSPRHLLKFHRFFLVFHHGSALHFSRQWPTTKRELKHLSWVKTP